MSGPNKVTAETIEKYPRRRIVRYCRAIIGKGPGTNGGLIATSVKKTFSVYLDLVRLTAAFVVMFGHASTFTGGYFHFAADHGAPAVAVFFVLSGFVISFITGQKEKTAGEYAVARAARMYSVAIPAILVTLVADHIGTQADISLYTRHDAGQAGIVYRSFFNPDWGWAEALRYLSFTNELWQSHVQVGSDEPYWSIGFEVWYYIVFGVFVFAPFKLAGRLLAALACLLIAGPKIALYLPLWLMGVACQRWIRQADGASWWARVPVVLYVLAFLATPLMYYINRHYLDRYTQMMFDPVGWNAKTFATVLYFHLIGLIFCINLFCFHQLAERTQAVNRLAALGARPIQWIAGATFTLYLAHQPVVLATLAANPLPKGSAAWAYSSVAATVVLIFVLAQFTERQKSVWKNLFSRLHNA